MDQRTTPPGLETALSFPLIEALHGRRARRFSMGAEIPWRRPIPILISTAVPGVRPLLVAEAA